MRCDFSSFFTRRGAAEYLGVSVHVITSAGTLGQLKPSFKQGGRNFYTKQALDEYNSLYRIHSAPERMLNFRESAEYLHTTKDYLHRLVYLNKITPDVKLGARKYFLTATLDSFLADWRQLFVPREVPEEYISSTDLLNECRKRNKKEGRKYPRSHNALSSFLFKKSIPHLRIRNAAGPGFRYVWQESAAWEALEDYSPRSYAEENHLIAPLEILRSAKWVTCRRAAEIIGCTAVEVSSRAAKYSFKSYLHPQTKKLLVNWLEVKERMKWRKPAFIIKHLGAAGYNLVRRTCEKKRSTHGTLYLVPELIGAELSYSER